MIIGLFIGFALGITLTTVMWSTMLMKGGKRRAESDKKVEALLTRNAESFERIAEVIINHSNENGDSSPENDVESSALFGWMSVLEELPRDGLLVLVWDQSGNGYPDCAFRDLGLWYCRAGGLQNVTHWLPLPKPPNEHGDSSPKQPKEIR